jgi:hypothetical protein
MLGFGKKDKVVLPKHQPTSKHMRILNLFKEKKTVKNSELNKIAFRYGAIIHDLRNEGHVIVTNQINADGLFEYTYKGKKKLMAVDK